jgi:hypothetical protein
MAETAAPEAIGPDSTQASLADQIGVEKTISHFQTHANEVLGDNGISSVVPLATEPQLWPQNKDAPFEKESLCGACCELNGNADVGDLIIWQGSTASKTLHCRGWNRSDDEWQSRVDTSVRRRDNDLARCADDAKFRTRLCNHWDTSLGTFCPMRKKHVCIFAHGPVELRVKEAKRNRWGKLVDKNGDNNNPNHSGGEDTYGAARAIESERKQEGKWNMNKLAPPKGNKKVQLTKRKHQPFPVVA